MTSKSARRLRPDEFETRPWEYRIALFVGLLSIENSLRAICIRQMFSLKCFIHIGKSVLVSLDYLKQHHKTKRI